jgi:tetratricopeptide (TPR) repeat protein
MVDDPEGTLVQIWVEESDLGFECECTEGSEGAFCKHCVALGLAWLRASRIKEPKPKAAPPAGKLIRKHLEALEKKALVDLILDECRRNKPLQQKLAFASVQALGSAADSRSLTSLVDSAFKTKRFLDYRAMPAYARRCREVIKKLNPLASGEQAALVIDLAEAALRGCEETLEHCDDSDGYMSGLMGDLEALHLSACKQCMPDPVALAQRLFEWFRNGEWDTFMDAPFRYQDVLGPAGLAQLRELTDELWEDLPVLPPTPGKFSHDAQRFRTTQFRMSLARADDDEEELLSILEKDQSSSYAFLQIARQCSEMGRLEQAVEWLEKGIAMFREHPNPSLHSDLTEALERAGRHDDAMRIVWEAYCARPELSSFRVLHAHAELAQGTWPEWRRRAVDEINRQLALSPSRIFGWASSSALLEIHLWEGELDDAIRALGTYGGPKELALELGRRVMETRPQAALVIFSTWIDRAISEMNQAGYELATECLLRVRTLLTALDRSSEFTTLLARTRAEHKPKHSLMRLLDTAGLR